MPVEVIMPKVDMDMERGRILVWHVEEGGRVNRSDPLFEIETAKAAMEIESPATGILGHIVAPAGSEVEIGLPVAWIYANGEAIGDPPATVSQGPSLERDLGEQVASVLDADRQTPSDSGGSGNAGLRATPAARRLALERGVGIEDIRGSGPRGRIQRSDVEVALDELGQEIRTEDRSGDWSGLSIIRTGEGSAPPFVLLHGFAADAATWMPLETLLPSSHPVIKIEMPCHGRSPLRPVKSFSSLVHEMRIAFDTLALESAHLVGHSLGGAVALAIADTRPESVLSLTLLSPAGLGPEINGAAIRGIAAASREESLGPWLRSLVADTNRIDGSHVRAAAVPRADPAFRAAQMAFADAVFPDGVQAFDLAAPLDRIQSPARIIWGKRDSVIPWTHGLRAPGSVSLHFFDRVGHLPHWEVTEAVASILGHQALAAGRGP